MNAASTLPDFRDRYPGATVLICGCGASLDELTYPERFTLSASTMWAGGSTLLGILIMRQRLNRKRIRRKPRRLMGEPESRAVWRLRRGQYPLDWGGTGVDAMKGEFGE